MLTNGFEIKITPESVDVCRDPAKHSDNGRFYGGLFILVVMSALVGFTAYLITKDGKASLWNNLQKTYVDPVLIGFALFLALLIALLCWVYIRYMVAAWPSDEALHCDSSAFTISKVKWLDWNNKWVTTTYRLSEIS